MKTQTPNKKYPANWKQIRAAILDRAGNKCERCGVANGEVGFRTPQGHFIPKPGCEVGTLHRERVISIPEHVGKVPGFIDFKIIRIVLTVAHIGPDDLALCQRCHRIEKSADRLLIRRARIEAMSEGQDVTAMPKREAKEKK